MKANLFLLAAGILFLALAAYGQQQEVSSPSFANDMSDVSGSYLTDSRDGKKYRIVKIGAQIWMAENLNYNASGSKCYDNNSANCDKYGRLYDWETAMKVCPSGWHLPSNAEWDMLYRFVDENYKVDYSKEFGGSATAGKHLKATSGWNTYGGKSGNGTDDYGFSALPGGGYLSSFGNAGGIGYWWSASEYDSSYAYFRFMGYDVDFAYWGSYVKSLLFSVRCVKD